MDTLKTQTIYCGDNLDVLSKFPENSVDLIYADPPFFSNKHYEIIWNDGAERAAFDDRWQGGVSHYAKWMRDRLMQCHRVLKENGSMYLHCDYHANAHLRIIMDEIFGENNFQNEIIWCYKGGGIATKQFKRKHDTIYFYGLIYLTNHITMKGGNLLKIIICEYNFLIQLLYKEFKIWQHLGNGFSLSSGWRLL